jgi:hypothetical protein
LASVLQAAPLDQGGEDWPQPGRDLPVSLLASWLNCSRRKVQMLLSDLRQTGVIDEAKNLDVDAFDAWHESGFRDAMPTQLLGKAPPHVLRAAAVLFGEACRRNAFVRSDAERASLACVSRATVARALALLVREGLVTVSRPLRRLGGGHTVKLKQLRRTCDRRLVCTLGRRSSTLERLEEAVRQGRWGKPAADYHPVQPVSRGGATGEQTPVQPVDNPNASLSEKDSKNLRTQGTAAQVPVIEEQPEKVLRKPEMGENHQPQVAALVSQGTQQLRAGTGNSNALKKARMQANLEHLRERVAKAPDAVVAVRDAALAGGAWVANRRPLVQQATVVAEHLVARHGPAQAKQLTLQAIEDVAVDAAVRDPGAVLAHRLRLAAVAPVQEAVRPAPAPMAAHLLQRQLAHGTRLCTQLLEAPEGPQRTEIGRELNAFLNSTPARAGGHTIEVLADAASVPIAELRRALEAVPLRRRLA